MSFLNHKGLVQVIFTQNIDSLESKASIPLEKVVFAHGNFVEAHCSGCQKDCEVDLLEKHICEGKVLFCEDEKCKQPIKHKIVFYGENLPPKFFEKMNEIEDCDLGIVMGTSLKVMPFNFLPYKLKNTSWRVVANMEKVGSEGGSGFNYDNLSSKDLFLGGKTDEIIHRILKDCGWQEEFENFVKTKSKKED